MLSVLVRGGVASPRVPVWEETTSHRHSFFFSPLSPFCAPSVPLCVTLAPMFDPLCPPDPSHPSRPCYSDMLATFSFSRGFFDSFLPLPAEPPRQCFNWMCKFVNSNRSGVSRSVLSMSCLGEQHSPKAFTKRKSSGPSLCEYRRKGTRLPSAGSSRWWLLFFSKMALILASLELSLIYNKLCFFFHFEKNEVSFSIHTKRLHLILYI